MTFIVCQRCHHRKLCDAIFLAVNDSRHIPVINSPTMSKWVSRIRSEPQSAPPILNSLEASWLQTPSTPRAPPKIKDPNAPDYRYQVNQKCIYERRLPGGSYITAHVQRLQSGFYDSPVIHEDCIDNVRFVAINFVFHPSRDTFRFKSAVINIALHHTGDVRNPLRIVAGLTPRKSSHDHGTQTETIPLNALLMSKDCLHIQGFKPSRPRFLRHAPHLLYGSISPETLNWNFNLAGSLGVSQGPVSASLTPSYGVKSSYKVYDMMKIQGSVRTLRSWSGHDYDIEDGEMVWTLEENKLQKSGLPREFTFVMLLTKGSGGFEESGDVRLEVDVHPKVMGRLGTTYPPLVTKLRQYQPFKRGVLDLDEEIGQVFEPHTKDRGFNFANIASNFDEFVWLPGNAYSTTEPDYSGVATAGGGGAQQQGGSLYQQGQSRQATLLPAQQASKPQQALPSGDTTLNLRVFLEPSRGSPVPFSDQIVQQALPYLNLRVPPNASRNQSPMPPSVTSSRKTGTRRTVTIGSSKSVRKQRSRSELGREQRSSLEQARAEVHSSDGKGTMKPRTEAPDARLFSYQEPEYTNTHNHEHEHDHGTQMFPNQNDSPTGHKEPVAPPPNASPEYTTPPVHPSQQDPEWTFQTPKQRQEHPTLTPIPTAGQRSSSSRRNGVDMAKSSDRRISFEYDNPQNVAVTSLSPLRTSAAMMDELNKLSTIAAQRASKQSTANHYNSTLEVRQGEERRPMSLNR